MVRQKNARSDAAPREHTHTHTDKKKMSRGESDVSMEDEPRPRKRYTVVHKSTPATPATSSAQRSVLHVFVSAPGDDELVFYAFDWSSSPKAEELVRMLAPPGETRVASPDALKRWLWIKLSAIDALDRKSTRLNSSHIPLSRMPSSA